MRSILCFNAMQFFTYHLRRKREIKNTFETVLCTNHDQKVLKVMALQQHEPAVMQQYNSFVKIMRVTR